jgi:putative FmdB family regulatory protein
MPTYEFECTNGHRFEKFYRKIAAAESELPCPECAEPAQRRISGGAGLLFKGSGFYITDYGKGGKKPAESTGTSDGSKPEGKSESKPAAPSTTPEKKSPSKE